MALLRERPESAVALLERALGLELGPGIHPWTSAELLSEIEPGRVRGMGTKNGCARTSPEKEEVMSCTETFSGVQRVKDLVGQGHGHQPETSLAWGTGDRDCEA